VHKKTFLCHPDFLRCFKKYFCAFKTFRDIIKILFCVIATFLYRGKKFFGASEVLHGDQVREKIDKECRNQKAGNDLRAFRWGTVADHPYVIYLHPTLSFANKASEKGSNCIPKATDFSFFFAVLLLLESVALPGFLGG